MATPLHRPALPLLAMGLGLAVAAVLAFAPGKTPQPENSAFASAELVAPPAPGSFAVASINTCVPVLTARLEPLRLNFPAGQTTLQPDHLPVLAQIADALADCPEAQITVAGHADGSGTDETNEALSWARADRAVSHLLALGTDPEAVHAVGYGATRPLSQGSDEEDAADRRVDFEVSTR